MKETYKKYLTLTGDVQAAANLTLAEMISSLDETVLSIYEDAKKQTILARLFK